MFIVPWEIARAAIIEESTKLIPGMVIDPDKPVAVSFDPADLLAF